jgi:hypothetical protein
MIVRGTDSDIAAHIECLSMLIICMSDFIPGFLVKRSEVLSPLAWFLSSIKHSVHIVPYGFRSADS